MKKLKNILSLVLIMGLVMSGIEVSAMGNYFSSCMCNMISVSEDFPEEACDEARLEKLFASAKDLMIQKVQVQYTADYKIFIDKLPSTQETPTYKLDYEQKTISIFVTEFDFDLLRCIIASALVRAQIHNNCCDFTKKLEDAFSQRCWLQSTSVDDDVYDRLVVKLIEKKSDILNDFIRLRDLYCDVEILFHIKDVALRRSIGEEVLLSMGISCEKIQEIKLTRSLENIIQRKVVA